MKENFLRAILVAGAVYGQIGGHFCVRNDISYTECSDQWCRCILYFFSECPSYHSRYASGTIREVKLQRTMRGRRVCGNEQTRAVVVFGAISPNPIVSCVIVLKYGALKSSPKCTPGDV